LIGCLFPIPDRPFPSLCKPVRCQVKYFKDRIVIRKSSPNFKYLAKCIVQGFHGIGDIDHFRDLRGIVEKHRESLPISSPAWLNGRILLIPPSCEFLPRATSASSIVGGPVYCFKVFGYRLAVLFRWLPWHVPEDGYDK